MLKYIVISDIHLGHNNTPTTHIVNNLIKYVLNERNKELDIIFLAGDLFDRLIDLNEEVAYVCLHFINKLLNYCNENNIKLRVLEGTPSHDWKQNKVIVNFNELRNEKLKVDLKYFDILDIEYIEEFNIHVLYIPDEWVSDNSILEKEIENKLIENNLDKIDIAILHGQFKYQTVNSGYKGFCYSEDYFLSKVKYYIHIGHYHTHSFFSRIIAQGSFDRLAHNEEKPKGYVYVTIDKEIKYEFIENKNSYIYKTIPLTDELKLEQIDKKVNKLPKYSYIRFSFKSDCKYNLNFDLLKLRYLDYYVKKHIKDKDKESISVYNIIDSEEIDFINLGFNNNNIIDSVYESLKNKYDFSEEQVNIAKLSLEKYRDKLIETI